MNFGYLGCKSLFVLGVFMVIESIILFSFEPIWQTPYMDKHDICHYKGEKFDWKGEGPPHKLLPTEYGEGVQEVVVKDHRYMSWVNYFRRMGKRL